MKSRYLHFFFFALSSYTVVLGNFLIAFVSNPSLPEKWEFPHDLRLYGSAVLTGDGPFKSKASDSRPVSLTRRFSTNQLQVVMPSVFLYSRVKAITVIGTSCDKFWFEQKNKNKKNKIDSWQNIYFPLRCRRLISRRTAKKKMHRNPSVHVYLFTDRKHVFS